MWNWMNQTMARNENIKIKSICQRTSHTIITETATWNFRSNTHKKCRSWNGTEKDRMRGRARKNNDHAHSKYWTTGTHVVNIPQRQIPKSKNYTHTRITVRYFNVKVISFIELVSNLHTEPQWIRMRMNEWLMLGYVCVRFVHVRSWKLEMIQEYAFFRKHMNHIAQVIFIKGIGMTKPNHQSPDYFNAIQSFSQFRVCSVANESYLFTITVSMSPISMMVAWIADFFLVTDQYLSNRFGWYFHTFLVKSHCVHIKIFHPTHSICWCAVNNWSLCLEAAADVKMSPARAHTHTHTIYKTFVVYTNVVINFDDILKFIDAKTKNTQKRSEWQSIAFKNTTHSIIDQHQLKVKMRFRVFDHGTCGYDCVTKVWI